MTSPDAPWEPEALTLRVGDRVTVWISGESDHTEAAWLHGIGGVVIQVGRPYYPGHSYWVRMDSPGSGCVNLARSELRLLERAP